jgi:hypothetical protein
VLRREEKLESVSAVLLRLGSSVIFNIEITNEENISLDSYFGEEDEVLLTPGTYLVYESFIAS